MRGILSLTRAGRLAEATSEIQRTLGAGRGGPEARPSRSEDRRRLMERDVIDAEFEVVTPARGDKESPGREPGVFREHSFAGSVGSRRYKLFDPRPQSDACRPLLVMLHGCTQDPDDFAAGTRMNEHAALAGWRVLYPAQDTGANPSRCWNWFDAGHQKRSVGEPAIIAGMVRAVAAERPTDNDRIYVAGLSAGAAMAVVLCHTHPELFAAAGVHSGLAYKSAENLGAALAAMKNPPPTHSSLQRVCRVPAIILHGDRDSVVSPRNGDRLFQSFVGREAATAAQSETLSVNGRVALRRALGNFHDGTRVEHWLVQGGGHGWFGGSPRGSHTETLGPDASAEMMRFFGNITPRGKK